MNNIDMIDLYKNMEEVRRKMENYEEDPSKKEEEWKKTLEKIIKISVSVKNQAIFSENELFSEIKAEDIKFLLIPYFQGELIQKFMDNRDSKLDLALKFYNEFYKKLDTYEYLTKEKTDSYKSLTMIEEDNEDGKKPSMEVLNLERTVKIQMYRYKKALSEKLKKLEKEENFEGARDYWVSYLELCWVKMLETIKMINLELDSIKYLKENKDKIQNTPQNYPNSNGSNTTNVKKGLELLKITPDNLKTIDPNNKLLQGIEIKTTHEDCEDCINNTHTHNPYNSSTSLGTNINNVVQNYTNVKDKVFRNANQPTMTLDDFADKEIARAKEQEEKQKEYNMEKPSSDSEDEKVGERKAYEAREWDDWKDDHPKGSGNRKK